MRRLERVVARQQKQKHECPNCGADLKKTIGAQSRRKYWVCTKSEHCYKKPMDVVTLSSNPW